MTTTTITTTTLANEEEKKDKLAIMNIFDYNCDSEKDGEVEMIAVIFGSGSGLL